VLFAVIAGCEIGFWVLLAAGLVARYLLRLPRVGIVLLAAVPLVDVVMLVSSVIDIHRGGEPRSSTRWPRSSSGSASASGIRR